MNSISYNLAFTMAFDHKKVTFLDLEIEVTMMRFGKVIYTGNLWPGIQFLTSIVYGPFLIHNICAFGATVLLMFFSKQQSKN